MKTNLYDVSRHVYGKEVSNMQPIAFGYVPTKQRVEAAKAVENNAFCVGEYCYSSNSGRFVRTAAQHG